MATMSFKRPRRRGFTLDDFMLACLWRQSHKTKIAAPRAHSRLDDRDGTARREFPTRSEKSPSLFSSRRRLGSCVRRGFGVGHGGFRLVRDRDEAQCLAHLGLDPGCDVFVFLQEL